MVATPYHTMRNRIFDEIAVGDSASIERTLTHEDITLFAVMSGDINPQHLDPEFAASTRFHEVIAHGMWGAALISALLGTRLPGPGTVYLGQTLTFLGPVRVGDTLLVKVTVLTRDPDRKVLTLACSCVNQDRKSVIEGVATVLAPTERIERPSASLPEVRLVASGGSQRLLDSACRIGRTRVAIVHPCDGASLAAVLAARAAGLIEPVLIAPRARLEATAAEAELDLSGLCIEDVPHSHAAAARGVAIAGSGAVGGIVQGSLDTGEFLAAVLRAPALSSKRRLSHCFLMHTPAYPRPFIITDAVIHVAPLLEHKADIVRNAIDLAHAIGVPSPRVAILAAVETVSSRMPATLDAAALCKMAERGQITGGMLDGPLAFDNAVSMAAARLNSITSPVAGQADVLVVPDMESGSLLVKQLVSMGNACSGGIAVGAKVPAVLTRGGDSAATRLASYALLNLLSDHYRRVAP